MLNRFFPKRHRSFIPVGWGICSSWENYPEWVQWIFKESTSPSNYAISVALRLSEEPTFLGSIDEWSLARLEFEHGILEKIDSEQIVLRYGVFLIKLEHRKFVDGDLLEAIQPKLQELDSLSTQSNRPSYYLSITDAREQPQVFEDDRKIFIGNYLGSFGGNPAQKLSVFASKMFLKDPKTLEEFRTRKLALGNPSTSGGIPLGPAKVGWGVFGMNYRVTRVGIERSRIRLTDPGLSYSQALVIKREFENIRAKGGRLPGQGFHTFDELKVMRDLDANFRDI